MIKPVNSTSRPLRLSGQATGAAQNQISPWILWVTFRRCWPWAVPAGAILAGIAAFAVFQTFVPTYRANHLLEANRDFVVFKGVMPTVDDLSRTEKQLFLNPIVIDPVLADPALREVPSLSNPATAESNLRQNLSFSSGGTNARLVVSYDDRDPVAAAQVCNAVVDSYLRQRDAIDSTRVSNLERWLEPEIQRWEQQVDEKQRTVQRLAEQTHGFAPSQRVSVMENQSSFSLLTSLRSQIADLNVQIAVMDAQQAMTSDNENQTVSEDITDADVVVPRLDPSEEDIMAFVNNDTAVKDAKKRIESYKSILLSMELRDLKRLRQEYYHETELKVEEWTVKLEEARAAARELAMVALSKKADVHFEERQRQARADLVIRRKQQEIERAQEQIAGRVQKERERETLISRLEVLQKEYDAERAQMEQFGGVSAELQFAQAELSVANEVLRKLRDRVAAIRTERRQDGAVRTLASATPPKTPVEKVPVKQMATASGAAFMIPFLLGLLWEFRVQRVTDSSTVENSGQLAPVVGEIARLPSRSRSGKGRGVFEESIDTLRANLFLSVSTQNTRSIAVASSMSGEGKSSVASQLAVSIAKATGKTVLLVDADLRCPDQHDMFGLEMGPGLSAVLAGEATLKESINTTLGNLIHVLPAGKLGSSPHRLLNPESFQGFLDQALEAYSYVVVDTAPVLSAGETLAVASSVDSTLLCVMRDVSRMETVTRATRRLQAAGANVTGTVFSGVSPRSYAYRYGDYQYALPGDEIA